MTQRITVTVFGLAVCFLLGGPVGLAAALAVVAVGFRPWLVALAIALPLTVAMAVATVAQGPFRQFGGFAIERPIAHLFGLGLASCLLMFAIGNRSAPRPDVVELRDQLDG